MRFSAPRPCIACHQTPRSAASAWRRSSWRPNGPVTAAGAGVLAYSITINDHNLAVIGAGLFLLTGLMVLLQWLIARRANCPLCMTPVLSSKGCAKHRSARTFFGSHRLRVAVAVLCLNRFRCPYCGESCEVKARTRRPR